MYREEYEEKQKRKRRELRREYNNIEREEIKRGRENNGCIERE